MRIKQPTVGGPLDGKPWTVRFPNGFLMVHRQDGHLVIYDNVDGKWVLRDDEEGIYRPIDNQRRIVAALGQDYDVIAYDEQVMGPWGR